MTQNITTLSVDSQLDNLSENLRSLEAELLPQIDGLSRAIPEIYAGYATMIHDIVNTTLELFKPSVRTANNIAIAAEIGARAVNAYGSYKAAKEHNRLMTKYMVIKKQYAEANIDRMRFLLPQLEKQCRMSAQVFKKLAGTVYRFDVIDEARISRISQIQLKALSIHRTNLFLLKLCEYLKNEYGVWISGKQRSEYDMPDYYLINELLLKSQSDAKLIDVYVSSSESKTELTGSQIMLLSDYQLSMMALGDAPCKINIENAHPNIVCLMNNCGAHEHYSKLTKDLFEQFNFNPKRTINIVSAVALAVIFAIVCFYLDASDGVKIGIGVASLAAILKIYVKGIRKATVLHAQYIINECDKVDKQVESACGKVDRPDIDYSERNALSSAISAFFN